MPSPDAVWILSVGAIVSARRTRVGPCPRIIRTGSESMGEGLVSAAKRDLYSHQKTPISKQRLLATRVFAVLRRVRLQVSSGLGGLSSHHKRPVLVIKRDLSIHQKDLKGGQPPFHGSSSWSMKGHKNSTSIGD